MRGLKGKVHIVTGAASGMGAATTIRLVAEGGRVIAADINADGLIAMAARAGQPEAILTVPFNLADEASIRVLVAKAAQWGGRIDGVVNVAADLSLPTTNSDVGIDQLDTAVWARILQVNLVGAAAIIREAMPHLIAAGSGSIVNISSAAASISRRWPAYTSSKGGLQALTRHIARCWGAKNIRCNAIAPGMVCTESVAANVSDEFKAKMLADICLPRLGTTDDMADAILFLLSDQASWITGQVISVDGGFVLRE
jgi:NAD(P)-dependent dehydrogenase (short-subunit alcohol dehydrogenase family)